MVGFPIHVVPYPNGFSLFCSCSVIPNTCTVSEAFLTLLKLCLVSARAPVSGLFRTLSITIKLMQYQELLPGLCLIVSLC